MALFLFDERNQNAMFLGQKYTDMIGGTYFEVFAMFSFYILGYWNAFRSSGTLT
jgi:hypothetical protein